jgi:hypothetical protein
MSSPPDKQGSFNVGISVFPVTLSTGRTTKVQLFYPTDDAPDPNCAYTIDVVLPPAGQYQIKTEFPAKVDAQPAKSPAGTPLKFPLIVHDHGGAKKGADNQRIGQFPVHELLASHGFIVAVALHPDARQTRIDDLNAVITALLPPGSPAAVIAGRNVAESIDPDKIGVSGMSAGGAAAFNVTALDMPPGRIKAMAVYEPGWTDMQTTNPALIKVPYLVMGGKRFYSGREISNWFELTPLALPRYYVCSPTAVHFNYVTSMGSELNQTREAALAADPTMPEPLSQLSQRSTTNAAAARACDIWNMAETVPFAYGWGSGRNFCQRVGVTSVSRKLDKDGDGFTDSPPFIATEDILDDPAIRPNPAVQGIREDVLVPIIKFYTVAFWKTHLEGDNNYAAFLTPASALAFNSNVVLDARLAPGNPSPFKVPGLVQEKPNLGGLPLPDPPPYRSIAVPEWLVAAGALASVAGLLTILRGNSKE